MTTPHNDKMWTDLRKAVFTRDQDQCTNCLQTTDDRSSLDLDHSVPRGAGGSDRPSNLNTLCRRCHDAKEGEDVAPSLHLESSGKMTDVEFIWFKHLLREMIPAMARSFDIRMVPKFGLQDGTIWYIPLGDVRRLDNQLYKSDEGYSSLRAEQYM